MVTEIRRKSSHPLAILEDWLGWLFMDEKEAVLELGEGQQRDERGMFDARDPP
jgi:hypothetical protein